MANVCGLLKELNIKKHNLHKLNILLNNLHQGKNYIEDLIEYH